MSDGEATGGEMPDGGKKKKIKLRVGSPSGSRAGTPAPGRAGSIGAGGSRAGSPAAQGQSMQSISPSPILYLIGGFVEDTLQYGFQEKWIMPRLPPQPPEPDFFRVNTLKHTMMKLATRFHLPQWGRAPQSMSFVEWLRGLILSDHFWETVRNVQNKQQESPLIFRDCYTKPCSPPNQSHPLSSTRYISSLHAHLLTTFGKVTAEPTRAQSPGLGPISVQEVIAAIPATGISSGALMKSFAGRVGDNPGQTDKKAFFSMVKEHSKYSADRLLRPK